MKVCRLAVVGLLLVLTGWWAAPERAYACSCVAEHDDPTHVQRAEVIFTGTMIDNRTRGQIRILTFTVDRVFKGTAYATQAVTTHRQGPACGLELAGPGPFVVFADRTGSPRAALEANSCGGTRTAPIADDLGPGHPPISGRSRTGGLAWLVPAAAGMGLLGVAIGFVVVRRRRSAGPEG